MKTVWMISGNKGNVGKSLFCLALASALETRRETFAVLDGDGRTKDVYQTFLRKCPSKWAEFRELDPDSHTGMRDDDYKDVIQAMLNSNNHVIVNTPDGVDSVLGAWFEKTLRHTEINNCAFKLVFVMSDRPDGLDMLPELMRRFNFVYPVRNLHFGSGEEFALFNREYSSRFDTVIDFPALRKEEAHLLFENTTYPIEAIRRKNGSGNYILPALHRSRLLTWQILVDEAISDVIDNEDIPNVKVIVE